MAKQKSLYHRPVPAILVRVEKPNRMYGGCDCFHVYGRFVIYDSSKREDVTFVHKYGDKWPPKEDLDLEDLFVWSQGDTDAEPDRTRLYGWELRYKRYSCTLSDVERMHSTLKFLDRGLDREIARTGHPQTFGAWMCYVALASKAEGFVFEGEHGYSILTPGESIRRIDNLTYEQFRCNQRKAEEAAA